MWESLKAGSMQVCCSPGARRRESRLGTTRYRLHRAKGRAV